MSRVSIAQRLWLGLAIIWGLFVVADLISLSAANRVDQALETLVSAGDERRGAGYDMRSELAAIVRAVQGYAKERDPEQLARLNKSQQAFERALDSYTHASTETLSRTLALRVKKSYAGFKRQCGELLRLSDARATALSALKAHQQTVNALLRSMPVPIPPARQSATVSTAPQTKELEQSLTAASRDLLARMEEEGEAFELNLENRRRLFLASLERYQGSTQTPIERAWANKAGLWYAGLTDKWTVFSNIDAMYEDKTSQLIATARRIEDSLTANIQPAARAELAAAVEHASGIAHQANVQITRGMLAALTLGALAAIATVRAVRSPLRRLASSMRRLADGDFSQRLHYSNRDELSQVIGVFNETVEKLQATTVSRGYLQSLVDSMSEAVIVVSDTGTVQTANPAAECLLGYDKGELDGCSSNLILRPGSNTVTVLASRRSVRLSGELVHREGFSIPVSIAAAPLPLRATEGAAMICVAQDLRERLAADRLQRQATVIFENSAEGVVLTDEDGAIVLANPAFCRITGFSTEHLTGRAIQRLWYTQQGDAIASTPWDAERRYEQWHGEVWIQGRDKSLHPVWANVSPVYDAAGSVANYVAVFSDISAIKEAEKRLNFLAYHDELTTLPNRSLLADRLGLGIERAQRSGKWVALLYLDLDDFKQVNDTLGHDSGDALLREMALRLSRTLRASDTVARLGGDKFIVVLGDIADVQ